MRTSSTATARRAIPRRKAWHHIKLIAVALGVVVALSSFLVAYVSGNLLDVVIKVVNLVVAPLFVLFFMALFVPWATSRGTVAGGLFAMLVAVLIAFVGIFGITALWIMPVALVSGVLSSMLFSLLDRWLIGPGPAPRKVANGGEARREHSCERDPQGGRLGRRYRLRPGSLRSKMPATE